MTGLPGNIIWRDPPPPRVGRREPDWLPVLQANVGRWAVVAVNRSASMTVTLRKRFGLETRSVKLPDGRFEIYARVRPEVVKVQGRGVGS